jgi:hypothetical protein
MDKKIIKGLIDEKLEVIQEQFSIIKSYDGKIPVIELDLIMANIRDLYELVINLEMENIGGVIMPRPAKEPEKSEAIPPPAPVTPAEPAASQRVSASFISIEPVVERNQELAPKAHAENKPEIPEPPFAPIITPAPEIIPEHEAELEPVAEPEPEPEPELEPEPENPEIPDTPTASELFAEQPPQPEKPQKIAFDLFSSGAGATLADRLREGQDKSLADKLYEHKVIDLRTTIGINDKFLFINELFEGNMRIYDDVIQKLNSAVTMAQADLLMLDLKIAYNWDSESPTVKKFVDLVRRKF